MIWLNKIFIVMLVFELTGCTQIDYNQREDIESEAVNAVIVSKPDKSLIITSEEFEEIEKVVEVEKEEYIAHSLNGFVFETMMPLDETISEITSQLCSPIASVPLEELPNVVSDPYNPPLMGKDDRHQGTDFAYYRRYDRASIAGDVVQSVLGGKLAGMVEDKYPYGNAVIVETNYELLTAEIQQIIGIQENQSLYTLYGHLENIALQNISNEVGACQPLGAVGKTGNTGVEHLHVEMRIGPSNQVIPSMGNYVSTINPAEKEAYLLWRTSGVFLHFDPMKILDIAP